ncbi:MAG: DUF5615 family PIN-like protein [Elusimicrobia bacterium]|nr:DUF5615 family PIN-like protein [Elusimicrobiota bacterium]
MPSTPNYTLYLNENISIEVRDLLVKNGIKTIHTLDAGNKGKDDEFQLTYAATNGWIMTTHNRRDFRRIHKAWNDAGKKHSGIILIGCAEPNIITRRVINFLRYHFPSQEPSFCEVPPEIQR